MIRNLDKPQGAIEGSDNPDESSGADKPAAKPGIHTVMVKVADPTTTKGPLPFPTKNETLSKLLDMIRTDDLERGKLPTFLDRQLASLAVDYATAAGSGTYAEPFELTEQQWDNVLKNNRAFHGYWYDFKTGVLVKAAKPGKPTYDCMSYKNQNMLTTPFKAFQLCGAAPVGKPRSDGADKTKVRYTLIFCGSHNLTFAHHLDIVGLLPTNPALFCL